MPPDSPQDLQATEPLQVPRHRLFGQDRLASSDSYPAHTGGTARKSPPGLGDGGSICLEGLHPCSLAGESNGDTVLDRLRTRVAFGALLAVVVASGQGVPAFGASSPAPSAPSSKTQGIAAEQSRAASAGQALGLSTGEKLIVKDVITDPDGSTHVRYNRTFDGLRVIGGDFVSHRAASGTIKSVSWNGAHQVDVASTTPKLSLALAQAAGNRKASLAHETTVASKGELVVYSGGASPKATPRLAYDVLTSGVRPDQTPSRLHTIVDANSGTTLASWDEIESGTGNGLYVGAVSIGTTAGTTWSMRDTVGNYTTDLNGVADSTGTVPGTTFTDTDDIWGNGAVIDRASAAVDAQYGAGKTFDYFKNIQGRNGIWNTGVGARSRVHYGNGYVNAFWDGTQMTYGDGEGNARPLVELDVAGHEMTHGVTENTAGLIGTGEAGGLNEATSDIFGTAVEWYANNAVDTPDYLIGELININGDGTPLRYLDRPSRDGISPDCWSATLGNLDSHYSAGPLDHWFYLASEGSGAKTLNGVAYNSPTCNASTVTGIGRDKAARIWYRTLTTYLTSSNTYAAAREGAIQSAKDLYGATSAECSGIAASFSAIAVPPGGATCATTAPTSSGGNLLGNPGFESGDTLWSDTPGVMGQNGTWGQPARSGTWSAWLGGHQTDAVTPEYFDSISQVVAIPASSSATLSYYLHVDTDETTTTDLFDTLTVRAGSKALQVLSNLNAANGYQLRTVDLSPYAGQTISLSFSSVEDALLSTSFVLDDLSVTTSASAIAPVAPTAVTAVAGNAAATVSWTAPASNGGSAITGYTVTAAPGGRTATTTGVTSATVTGLTNGTAYTFTVTAVNIAGVSPASTASAPVVPSISGGFTGVAPSRVLDTRVGLGAPTARLGAGESLTLTVPGLPVGVVAVALNVTATGPTAASYLTVYPGGQPRPTASSLNFVAGQTIPNMVLVPVGPDNTVTVYNAVGTVNVIADLVGYYG
jgi:Zn-dependent metalloprotease